MLAKLALMAVALGVGVLLSMQPAVNGDIARRAGSPYAAAVVSLTISMALMLPVALVFGRIGSFGWLVSAPWWIVLGGLAGTVYVVSGITIAPVLGMVLFIACVILGQAIGSTVIDQLGLFSLPQRPVNLWKALGLGMILGGMVLVVSQR
jgi:transporter family-2 protein